MRFYLLDDTSAILARTIRRLIGRRLWPFIAASIAIILTALSYRLLYFRSFTYSFLFVCLFVCLFVFFGVRPLFSLNEIAVFAVLLFWDGRDFV